MFDNRNALIETRKKTKIKILNFKYFVWQTYDKHSVSNMTKIVNETKKK